MAISKGTIGAVNELRIAGNSFEFPAKLEDDQHAQLVVVVVAKATRK